MFLAEVERLTSAGDPTASLETTVAAWQTIPASVVQDHGERCCRIARGWFFAMDHAHLSAGDVLLGPRWIRARYKWGPTRWPLYWCEAMNLKTLDCGALAALAVAAYQSRGVRCYTTQLVQRYSKHDARNWLRNWKEGEASINWIKDDLVYHEACAMVSAQNEIRIWDPTASWWVNPKQFAGYGAVLALRVLTSNTPHASYLKWGTERIFVNNWQHVQPARADFAK